MLAVLLPWLILVAVFVGAVTVIVLYGVWNTVRGPTCPLCGRPLGDSPTVGPLVPRLDPVHLVCARARGLRR